MSRRPFAFALSLLVVVGGEIGCEGNPDPIVVVRAHDSGSPEDSSLSAIDAPDETASDAGVEVRDPDANCVKPGTPDNDAGVGGYCETQDDCKKLDGGLCTAKYTTDPTEWFCTKPCDVDSQCGFGAICAVSTDGNGCVPISCVGPDDGGSDATDADADGD